MCLEILYLYRLFLSRKIEILALVSNLKGVYASLEKLGNTSLILLPVIVVLFLIETYLYKVDNLFLLFTIILYPVAFQIVLDENAESFEEMIQFLD